MKRPSCHFILLYILTISPFIDFIFLSFFHTFLPSFLPSCLFSFFIFYSFSLFIFSFFLALFSFRGHQFLARYIFTLPLSLPFSLPHCLTYIVIGIRFLSPWSEDMCSAVQCSAVQYSTVKRIDWNRKEQMRSEQDRDIFFFSLFIRYSSHHILLPSPISSYPILSYSTLSYPIIHYLILSYTILSYIILPYPILSSHTLSYHILPYPIQSYIWKWNIINGNCEKKKIEEIEEKKGRNNYRIRMNLNKHIIKLTLHL